jgi:predicted methyltransferase
LVDQEMDMRGMMVRTALALAIVTAGGASLASSPSTNFPTILADPARPEADRARDADRKPAELVAFARLKQGAQVAELAPGGGYFTRLLSAFVGPKGHVYAVAARPSPALTEIAGNHANVSIIAGSPGDIPVPGPVDMVWTTLNYHDFKNSKQGDSDAATLFNRAAFKALKPGGIYLIVDHQAAPGAGASVTSTLHRIEETVVKSEVEAAGFRLDGESDLLRHAADDHSLKVQETGIRGKTDQFILRFRKPR